MYKSKSNYRMEGALSNVPTPYEGILWCNIWMTLNPDLNLYFGAMSPFRIFVFCETG